MTSVEERVARIEDRTEITDLAVLYGYVMDERDVEGIRRIFCDDATLRSADGVFAASGIEEIVRTYEGRFAALGATNHFTHGHVIRFDGPDSARGLLASHAEVVRDGKPMVVALRYQDSYRRTAQGWKFADRLMSYMYYVDVREYAEALGTALRVRAYGDQRPADWPEVLNGTPPTWLKNYLR
ncbi:nuclear transport factor 2 family protein [Amycolatopsis sp. K13G38]|uniref:Nuclear transport factor 2 family protein n=1 Tax=Amycolatopsis acididurans TaxID=2724524 RepID=A0ABX1J7M5_9PSEU|nr:nuclear transport factor 2 family protein [Amycolatopsis acididurans]NKQ55791.1 nuclear transport factor 2 family protein [Amycolatopsis acididurans]